MKVFVYGTLRKGMVNDYMMKDCLFIGYGYLRGSLYMIENADYPGYIEAGSDLILGEIYEVDESNIEALDYFEGYLGKGRDNLYDKVICPIYDSTKIIDYLPVYVYHILNNPKLGVKIESGDFSSYIKNKG